MAAQAKLKNRYEIKETLGQGGMGVVYKAHDSVIRRDVAIKTIRDTPDPAALETFHKECGVLASMAHPNIVEIFDLGEFEDNGANKPYFVMPLLPGATLESLIRSSSQRLTVARVVDIVSQTCRGLQAAHERGLVHRDLKPSNIFVMADDSVKIIDFGIAHIVDARTTMSLKGTLAYMAPEQIEMKPLSALSDIFSLGVVAFEALTLRRPFQVRTQAEMVEAILHQVPPPVFDFNSTISQPVSRVIHKAMAKQPWHRFSSAREFAETLSKALRNEAIEMFEVSRILPRIERARKAFEQSDYQFASEILSELEAEGHLDESIGSLQRQINQMMRQKTVQQLLQSAHTRLDEGEYPLALQKLQEALQLDPGNAEALNLKSAAENRRTEEKIDDWFRLARQHIDHYDFSHAREALQNVLQLRPNETTALQLFSEVSRRQQDYLKILQRKKELYQVALAVWQNGDVSAALSKLQQVMELDRRAPDLSAPESGTLYQNFYNQVRSEHDAMNHAYAEARTHLAERDFAAALALCDRYLSKYPNYALFQALKFDVDEQQRQELSGQIAIVNRRVEAEPDLDRRVSILKEAAERFPGEAYFEPALRLMRDKRDLVNSIVAKARLCEEHDQYSEALAQWEILKTIYGQYPGLSVEMERVVKRRDHQTRSAAKARWVEQVDLHLELGEYSRASELLREAQAEFPGDAELGELERLVNQGLEKAAEAQQLLEQGQQLCAGKRVAEGLDALARAHQLDDRNPVIRAILVNALVEQGRALVDTDWRVAEPLIHKALDLDPANRVASSLKTLAADNRREAFVSRCISQARQAQASGDLKAALGLVEQGLGSYPNDFRLIQLLATLNKGFGESRRRSLEELKLLSRDSPTITDPGLFESTLLRARTIAGQYPEDPEIQILASKLQDRKLSLTVTFATPARGAASATSETDERSEASTHLEEQKAGATVQPEIVAEGVSRNEDPSSIGSSGQPSRRIPSAGLDGLPVGRPRRKNSLWIGIAAALCIAAAAGWFLWARSRLQTTSTAGSQISLEIRTNPQGADIFVDGQLRGRSNSQLELPAGKHDVRAELEGYEPAATLAILAADRPASPLEFQLVPKLTVARETSAVTSELPSAARREPVTKGLNSGSRAAAKATAPREQIFLAPTLGVLVLKRSPANVQVSIQSPADLSPRTVGEERLELLEGSYILTATAPGYSKMSIPAKIEAGKTIELALNLQPAKETPLYWKVFWENPDGWDVEGQWLVRKGGNFVLSNISPTAGFYTLTIWRKSKELQWVVNYHDAKNYWLFEIESKSLNRTVVRDGKKGSTIKVPHSFDKQNTYVLQVAVTESGIVHRILDGKKWVTLDELKLPANAAALGKFGLFIPNKDEVGVSHFSFKPL